MSELNDLIFSLGLPGIAIVVFIESGFPVGFFLPGDTMLFAAGILAASGHFSLALAIAVIFVANFLGVTIGYWTGKEYGKRYIREESKFLFKKEYVEKAEDFYKRHGGKAIILGRFIPAVRAFIPAIAGIAKMPYRELMIYNAIGAALWSISVPALGYFAGDWLKAHGIDVEMLILPIILAIIAISLLGPVVHALQNPKTRKAMFASIKKQYKKLLKNLGIKK